MIVFARTSRFKPNYYRQSVTVQFPIATQDTLAIVSAALRAVPQIFAWAAV